MNLILASQSPRRRELLGFFRIPFTVRVADIDETMTPGASAYSEVARISHLKAMAIPREPEDVVVAADTIVVCQGKILGKPRTEEEARQMLRLLSGRDHQVMTGMTVLYGEQSVVCTEVTDLHFRNLSEGEIDAYVASGEPMDKAGAYGIQGGAALFCPRMEGDYYNVMGLPVCRLSEIFRQLVPELMGELL
jgi:septum formation protein